MYNSLRGCAEGISKTCQFKCKVTLEVHLFNLSVLYYRCNTWRFPTIQFASINAIPCFSVYFKLYEMQTAWDIALPWPYWHFYHCYMWLSLCSFKCYDFGTFGVFQHILSLMHQSFWKQIQLRSLISNAEYCWHFQPNNFCEELL